MNYDVVIRYVQFTADWNAFYVQVLGKLYRTEGRTRTGGKMLPPLATSFR